MNYVQIINSILVLAVIIFIGFIITKLRVIDKNGASVISNVIMKVTFPAIILTSMQKSFTQELFKNSIALIGISMAIYVVLIIFVTIFGRVSSLPLEKLKIMKFLIIFGNVAFMGFPVASALYKDVGIFYASCFNMFYNLLMFSYGIMILDKKSKKINFKNLINPGLISTIIGFIFFLTSSKLPYIIFRPLEWVGDMTIPLALLVVGNSLAEIKFKDLINDPMIWIYSLERLLIFPCALMFILKFIGLSSYLLVIPVVIMATPAPLTAGVFARAYGGDELFADKSIVLSNFLAIVTVPLIIFLIGM
ncbi:AEC family transporter [Clostridium sp. PL3]|uniref:AEC family transporter n=1 Tax=Clostridium thailandense TaxID=2794346 RepID=A0A949TZ95_9CLOT|nr:AEC family transporter [Clostridium thailandense]MBV7276401.1 AEC family transporter [Clostridium thailandense]